VEAEWLAAREAERKKRAEKAAEKDRSRAASMPYVHRTPAQAAIDSVTVQTARDAANSITQQSQSHSSSLDTAVSGRGSMSGADGSTISSGISAPTSTRQPAVPEVAPRDVTLEIIDQSEHKSADRPDGAVELAPRTQAELDGPEASISPQTVRIHLTQSPSSQELLAEQPLSPRSADHATAEESSNPFLSVFNSPTPTQLQKRLQQQSRREHESPQQSGTYLLPVPPSYREAEAPSAAAAAAAPTSSEEAKKDESKV
jgi:hypothetical protein